MTFGKKHIFIQGPGMELGGIERSLLGLLDSIDYEKYEVDLFLFTHKGELMPYINKNVNLLPKNKLISNFYICAKDLVKGRHFIALLIKMISKTVYLFHKQKGVGEDSKDTYMKISALFAGENNKQYDLALGFSDPFFYMGKKIKAAVKIGWAHTDWNTLCKNKSYIPAPNVWKEVDYVACVSADIKSAFDELYPQYSTKSLIIENILSSEYVRKMATAFSVEKEMPPTFFSILSVGRFSSPKNFLEAIRACNRLKDDGIVFKWYFIGFGPQEDEMRELISTLDVEDVAIILGKKVNPYPYMKACNLYVQPSIFEGKAVTVREAQMLGKTVLITAYPSSGAQLENGVDGHICELSLDGIVEGVKHMMSHSDYCAQLSNNALSRDYSGSAEIEKIMCFAK